jgi:hypothetical protein
MNKHHRRRLLSSELSTKRCFAGVFGGRLRIICWSVGGILALLITASTAGLAQKTASPKGDAKLFFTRTVGEWIGTCEQSTDGEQADDKYLHAVVRQVDDTTFESVFDYYRLDKESGGPVSVGKSTMVTTFAPDGTAQNKITGDGHILVNEKPRGQRHELLESLTAQGDGSASLHGSGKGSISVSGMPLGLGRNGKVDSMRSTWEFSDDVLTIHQDIKASFRALIFKKSFDVAAHFVARRGSDIASLLKTTQVSSLPSTPAKPTLPVQQ